MNIRLFSFTLSLFFILILSPVWAFDTQRTKTKADSFAPADGSESFVIVNFISRLSLDDGEFTPTDMVVTWENAGGVDPVPFKVLIPEGCFVQRGRLFFVRDFQSCGVQITFEPGDDVFLELPIINFSAELIVRRNGNARLNARTSFTDLNFASEILGAVGGAVVEISIGAESATSLPRSIESVSGVSPTPF